MKQIASYVAVATSVGVGRIRVMNDSLVPKTGIDRNGHPYTRNVRSGGNTIKDARLPGAPKVVAPTVADILSRPELAKKVPQIRYPAGVEWTGSNYRFYFASQNRGEDFIDVRGKAGKISSAEDDASVLASNATGALQYDRCRSIVVAVDSDDDYSLEVMTDAKKAAEEASGLNINYGEMQALYQYGEFINTEYPDASADVKADALSALILGNVSEMPTATPYALWEAYSVYAKNCFFARVDPYVD